MLCDGFWETIGTVAETKKQLLNKINHDKIQKGDSRTDDLTMTNRKPET